jgi:Alpha 1,4-glycosyltransferase conserved region
MLWIGERLSPIERACMRSVLRQGHRLRLYTYGELAGVPEGVELADAAAILPAHEIVTHHSGSVALFSDRFRFELQRRGLGPWLDADVYLLAPLMVAPGAHVFGWIEPNLIGAGILALPPGSPLLAPVLGLFEAPHVPGWLTPAERAKAHWRHWRQGTVELGKLPWGVAGPRALTALARRHGLLGEALPREAFYPYHWREAAWIFDPARALDEFVTPATRAVHLYNFMIADRKHEAAAPGSFFARLQQEGA